MSQCPKCGKKLKLTDVSQFCPACGVNMRFVNFEDNFYKEAKIAELSQARMHVKIKRLKASFIGSKLMIARLICALFPVLSLLLASGSFTVVLPFYEKKSFFSALGIFELFKNGELNYFFQMRTSDLLGGTFTSLFNALAVYAGVAVFAVLTLLLTVLGFLSIYKMQKVICTFACLGIANSVAAIITLLLLKKETESSFVISVSNGFGLILTVLLFSVVVFINIIIQKKGVPVEYGEGMPERAEIFKQVKAGAVNIEDLPQPIIETEETRKIDEEIAKEERLYQQKHQKEENGRG